MHISRIEEKKLYSEWKVGGYEVRGILHTAIYKELLKRIHRKKKRWGRKKIL